MDLVEWFIVWGWQFLDVVSRRCLHSRFERQYERLNSLLVLHKQRLHLQSVVVRMFGVVAHQPMIPFFGRELAKILSFLIWPTATSRSGLARRDRQNVTMIREVLSSH